MDTYMRAWVRAEPVRELESPVGSQTLCAR